ncbi:MAG: PLP-dependent aminotransferase family protein [Burkholderiales bacterium]|nr:MAG: PLP-dependent aminotransferase family protein [Burkholderiales bacterium]
MPPVASRAMNKTSALALDILIELASEPRGRQSVVLHLTRAMRMAILSGRLVGGTRLPSTRTLARATGIGRSSIVEVVEQLAMEGYLETRQGACTRVAVIDTDSDTRTAPASAPPLHSERWVLDDPPTPVTTKAFRAGLPDLQGFPSAEWATLVARRCRHPISHDLSYAHQCGLPALREALLVHLRQMRGVQATPEQVIIVPTAQAAFAILADASLRPGDIAWVEDPGYPGIRSVLRGRGAHIMAKPVDQGGMTLDSGETTAPKLIYTTPSHQFPTGVTMPLPRRLALLDQAARAGALVIEDDYDSEYQYHGRPIASLQGLDSQGCVAYVGTFSKTLAPGLRMAYMVVPPRWRALVETIATVNGYAVPVHLQLAMADFISGGGFHRHLRRVTAEAGERIRLLAQTLLQAHEPRLEVPTPLGGLQMCVGWTGKAPDTELARRLLKADVVALPLSTLCHGTVRQGLVLGVGLVRKEDIGQACQRLLRCARTL